MNHDSHADATYASPGLPPTATTVVPSSSATAPRFVCGSRTKTKAPAATSTSSSPRMKRARPDTTT